MYIALKLIFCSSQVQFQHVEKDAERNWFVFVFFSSLFGLAWYKMAISLCALIRKLSQKYFQKVNKPSTRSTFFDIHIKKKS